MKVECDFYIKFYPVLHDRYLRTEYSKDEWENYNTLSPRVWWEAIDKLTQSPPVCSRFSGVAGDIAKKYFYDLYRQFTTIPKRNKVSVPPYCFIENLILIKALLYIELDSGVEVEANDGKKIRLNFRQIDNKNDWKTVDSEDVAKALVAGFRRKYMSVLIPKSNVSTLKLTEKTEKHLFQDHNVDPVNEHQEDLAKGQSEILIEKVTDTKITAANIEVNREIFQNGSLYDCSKLKDFDFRYLINLNYNWEEKWLLINFIINWTYGHMARRKALSIFAFKPKLADVELISIFESDMRYDAIELLEYLLTDGNNTPLLCIYMADTIMPMSIQRTSHNELFVSIKALSFFNFETVPSQLLRLDAHHQHRLISEFLIETFEYFLLRNFEATYSLDFIEKVREYARTIRDTCYNRARIIQVGKQPYDDTLNRIESYLDLQIEKLEGNVENYDRILSVVEKQIAPKKFEIPDETYWKEFVIDDDIKEWWGEQ